MTELNLPKTKISFSDGILKKCGADGVTISQCSLESIKDVTSVQKLDYIIVIFFIIFLSFALLSKIYIPSPGWGWALTVFFICLALISLTVTDGRKIIVETSHGNINYIVTSDPTEVVDAFVICLKQIIADNQDNVKQQISKEISHA